MKDVKMLVLGMVVGLSFFTSFSKYLLLIPLAMYAKRMLAESSLKQALKDQYLYSLTYHLVGLSWILSGYHELTFLNTAESIIFLICAWLIICAILSLFYLLVPIGLYGFRKRFDFKPVSFVFLYASAEFLTELGSISLPWLRLGLLNQGILGIFGASIGGVYLNTIIVLAIATCIGMVNLKNKKNLVLCMVAMVCFYVNIRLPSDSAIPVSLIQGNVSSSEKWVEEANDLTSLIAQGGEYAFTSESIIVEENSELEQYIENSTQHIIYGKLAKVDGKTYNEVHCNASDDVYRKQHLVPVGEYVPSFLKDVLPILNEVNLGNELTSGSESVILNVDDFHIATMICFEDIYPGLAREGVMEGANILYVPSNDIWFNSIERYQHMLHARMRSQETHRALIRVGNVGYTFVTDVYGQIHEILPLDSKDVLETSVILDDSLNFYMRYGYLLPYVILILLILNLKEIRKDEWMLTIS